MLNMQMHKVSAGVLNFYLRSTIHQQALFIRSTDFASFKAGSGSQVRLLASV